MTARQLLLKLASRLRRRKNPEPESAVGSGPRWTDDDLTIKERRLNWFLLLPVGTLIEDHDGGQWVVLSHGFTMPLGAKTLVVEIDHLEGLRFKVIGRQVEC